MKRLKKISLSAICLLLALTTLATALAYAAPNRTLQFTFSNGGSWVYNGRTDTDITGNWSERDWRSVMCVQQIQFYTPNQVQAEANLLGISMGMSQQQAGIHAGVDWAVSSGISIAKEKLISKFGATVAGKLIPYLNIFSWGYTACTTIDAMAKGQELGRYADAARKGKGLVYVEQSSAYGDGTQWYYWDGSGPYGSYPTAILGPNNWQFGKVTKH